MRTTQKRGNAERAEKRGERGNPEWGARTYAKKGACVHSLHSLQPCPMPPFFRSRALKRRDSGGLRGGARVEGMRERSRRRAEDAWKGHGGGKLSFRKAEGKAIPE